MMMKIAIKKYFSIFLFRSKILYVEYKIISILIKKYEDVNKEMF